MTVPASPDITPSGVLLALGAYYLGPLLAPYVTVYGLILLGWCCGVFIGAYTRPVDGQRMPVLVFAFVTFLAVVGLSVTASKVLVPFLNRIMMPGSDLDVNSLLFPVAITIPAMGYRWGIVRDWLINLISRKGA